MADVLVGNPVHADLRVHRHREDAVLAGAADAVRRVRRLHPERHRLRLRRRVEQRRSADVARAAVGDARHVRRVVTTPGICRRPARHRRTEGHRRHLSVVADHLVGNLVHSYLRVHRHRERAVGALAADAVGRVRRANRERHRLRHRRRVEQRRSADVARAAVGDARHIRRVVTTPGVCRSPARQRRAEGHCCHLCVMADYLVSNLVHPDLRVNRDGKLLCRSIACHATVGKVRGHLDGGRHRSRAGVRRGKCFNVTLTAGCKTNARCGVRPRVGSNATCILSGECYRCRAIVAYHLTGDIIHLSCRVNGNPKRLRSTVANHTTILEMRSNRDDCRHRRCASVSGRKGCNIAVTIGIQTDGRGVVLPRESGRTARGCRGKCHSLGAVSVANHLIFDRFNLCRWINGNREGLLRSVARHTAVGEVRRHLDGGRHRLCAVVHRLEGCNVAIAGCAKANGSIVVFPCIGGSTTCI